MIKLKRLAAVLAIFASALGSAPAVWAGTMDALLAEPGNMVVVHLEDMAEGARRLATSFALETLENEGAVSHGLADWLMTAPLSSISLAMGGDGAHGAVAFSPQSERVKELLGVLERGEEPEGPFVADLLAIAMTEELEEDLDFSIILTDVGQKIYEVEIDTLGVIYDLIGDWDFYVSPEKDGGEIILLVGSEPECVEKARAALRDPGKRLTVKGAGKGQSFIHLNDNSEGLLFEALTDALELYDVATAKSPLFLELSTDLTSEKMVISLKHNLFSVLFGAAEKPKSALSLEDKGLRLGGGEPFFAGLGGLVLKADQVLDVMMVLLEAEDMDREDARDELKSMGIDLDQIVGALRSAGVVLGGEGAVGPASAPGGYVFLSGISEGMKALIPLVEMVVETLPIFEESPREGWDLFYKPSEEFYEELPLPLFIGMKDGVLVFGSIEERELETDPEFRWGSAPKEGAIGQGRLDMRAFTSLVARTLSSRSLAALKDNDLDLEEGLEDVDVPAMGVALKALQGIGAIEFSGGWDSIEVVFEPREVDHQLLNELSGAIKRLARE